MSALATFSETEPHKTGVANQLKWLGTGDAAGPMGAIEFLGAHVGEKLSEVAEAIRDTSTDHPLMGETFEGVSSALGDIAQVISGARWVTPSWRSARSPMPSRMEALYETCLP